MIDCLNFINRLYGSIWFDSDGRQHLRVRISNELVAMICSELARILFTGNSDGQLVPLVIKGPT